MWQHSILLRSGGSVVRRVSRDLYGRIDKIKIVPPLDSGIPTLRDGRGRSPLIFCPLDFFAICGITDPAIYKPGFFKMSFHQNRRFSPEFPDISYVFTLFWGIPIPLEL